MRTEQEIRQCVAAFTSGGMDAAKLLKCQESRDCSVVVSVLEWVLGEETRYAKKFDLLRLSYAVEAAAQNN